MLDHAEGAEAIRWPLQRSHLSREASDLVRALLRPEPALRLGAPTDAGSCFHCLQVELYLAYT